MVWPFKISRTTSANTKYWEWLSVRLGFESMHKSVGDFIRGTYFRFFILVLNLVVDFIFCLLYLVELQITSPKYELDPYWLFISRPAGFYDVLLAFSFFNAFMSICKCLLIFFPSKDDCKSNTKHKHQFPQSSPRYMDRKLSELLIR